MPQKTFGSIRYDSRGSDAWWTIAAQPDVMTRLKRIFPRVQASRRGDISIQDSNEVRRDLEWVMTRWAMEISDGDLERIAAGADDHRGQEERVTALLMGKAKHAEMPMEPARPLREYQKLAHDIVETTGALLLADELGLGKTSSSLASLSDPANRPMLAVTLNGLQKQWLKELGEVFPELRGVEVKGTKPYDLSDDEGNEPDLIVMNYAKLSGWADHLAGRVKSVVFDEVQELRRDGSQKHLAACQIAHQARRVVGNSATPVYNFGGEMHSILSVISPGAVGTKAEFGREWCGSSFGLDRKTRIADPEGFRQWMTDQGIFLRRTREEVGIQMPELTVTEYPVDVDDQRWNELLKTSDVAQIAEIILNDEADHKDKWRAAGQLDYRMRYDTGMAKAPGVAAIAKLILESEEKILLAGWHRECFGRGTRVRMADGTVREIQDVAEGDRVAGPDSSARTVKSLVRGKGRMYRVIPNKGESWVCSAGHMLTLWEVGYKKYVKMTADEFFAKSRRRQREFALYRSPLVTFPDAHDGDFPEPWLLGLWLGDGATNLRSFTVMASEKEIIDELHTIADQYGLKVSDYPSPGSTGASMCRHWRLAKKPNGPYRNPLLAMFKKVGLEGGKHIPEEVLSSSPHARREVLAGLIDSDGYTYEGNGTGTCEYTTVLPHLAQQVASLARSLGFSAYVRENPPSKSSNAYGEVGSRKPSYRVTMTGDWSEVHTRLSRKRGGKRSGQKNVLHTGFRVEPLPVDEYYGFELEEDPLFLLEDYTVVHNCYSLWQEQLAEYNPVLYTGTESAAGKRRSFEAFTEGDSRIMMISLRSGAGLDGLQGSCRVALFGELDWSPGVHKQLLGRLHRPGQTQPVTGYFCVSDYGSDPVMLDALDLKKIEADLIVNGPSTTVEQVDPEAQKDRMRQMAQEALGRTGAKQ